MNKTLVPPVTPFVSNFGRNGPGLQQGAQKGMKRMQNALNTPSDKIREGGMRRVKRVRVNFAEPSGPAPKRLKPNNLDFNASGPTKTPRVGMTSSFSERSIPAMPSSMEKTVKMRRNEEPVKFNRPTKALKTPFNSPTKTLLVKMDTNDMKFVSPEMKTPYSLVIPMAPKMVLTSSDRTNWRKEKIKIPVSQLPFDECNGQGENDKSVVDSIHTVE